MYSGQTSLCVYDRLLSAFWQSTQDDNSVQTKQSTRDDNSVQTKQLQCHRRSDPSRAHSAQIQAHSDQQNSLTPQTAAPPSRRDG